MSQLPPLEGVPGGVPVDEGTRAKYAHVELGAARVLIIQAPLLTYTLLSNHVDPCVSLLQQCIEQIAEQVRYREVRLESKSKRSSQEDQAVDNQLTASRQRKAELEAQIVQNDASVVAENQLRSFRRRISSSLVPQLLSEALALGFTLLTHTSAVATDIIVQTWTLTRAPSDLNEDQLHRLREAIDKVQQMRTWTDSFEPNGSEGHIAVRIA